MGKREEAELLTTHELINLAKAACHVDTPTQSMTDEEIRKVVRWIAMTISDWRGTGGDLLLNRSAQEIMLFVTVSEFPQFYVKYGLSQYN